MRSLAADLSREIETLEEIRTRALELAASTRLGDPMETWQAALRRHGLLGEGAVVPARDRQAVELVDGLHPDGIDGVLQQSSGPLSDRGRRASSHRCWSASVA